MKPFSNMIGDALGGVILSYCDYESGGLNVLRIDYQGNYVWGENGIQTYFGKYLASVCLVADGSGGVIICQQDLSETERCQLFAQRIAPDGTLPWGWRGVILHYNWSSLEPVEAVTDGAEGIIVVGADTARGEIRVWRLNARGTPVWGESGKMVREGGHSPFRVKVVSDGAEGAIVVWQELNSLPALLAQKLDSAGNTCWRPEGIEVFRFDASQNYYADAVSDGAGGAIIAWWYQGMKEDKKGGLKAQRLDFSGRPLWGPSGLMVARGDDRWVTHASVSSDGLGGVLIACGAGKSKDHAREPFVQQIDTNGNLLWGKEGLWLKGW